MKKIKIDWDDLLLAYGSYLQGSDMHPYLYISTGKVITTGLDNECNEEDHYDKSNLLLVPSRNSRDDYADIQAFIATIDNTVVRNKLFKASYGKGAFKRFNRILSYYSEEKKRWSKFRENRYVHELIGWLEDNDLEPESIPVNDIPSDNVVYLSQGQQQQAEDSGYITDPKETQRLAEEKLDENYDFRAYFMGYLKWSDKRLDEAVHTILNDVEKHIDCSKCMNCCIESQASMDETEIQSVADKLNMSVEDFLAKYFNKNKFGEMVITTTPCPFFIKMTCTIDDCKPVKCREFPFLHKDGFRSRSLGVIANTTLCPIVYNVIEELKTEVGWRKNKKGR
jgi:uncharacterized protein